VVDPHPTWGFEEERGPSFYDYCSRSESLQTSMEWRIRGGVCPNRRDGQRVVGS